MSNMVETLVNRLRKYREKYYEGNPIISDERFDFEERRLKELDPNNDYFYEVGYRDPKTTPTNIEIKHKIPMLSMQKVQTVEKAKEWIFSIIKTPGLYFSDKIGMFVWVEPKIDGISGKLVYGQDGKLLYGSTRGDGETGLIIPYTDRVTGVPLEFLANSEIRGEFYISKIYSKQMNGPLRNVCNGILKRKEYTDDMKYVSFITYDYHTYSNVNEVPFGNRKDKIDKLVSLIDPDKIVNSKQLIYVPVIKTSDIETVYNDYINRMRSQLSYETDGLIMTIDGGQDNYDIVNKNYIIKSFNRYNMALKPPSECGSSTVLNIVADTSRTKITPVAVIEPITINGITASRATLNNYADMIKKNIGIGTTVLVERTNDVLPKIADAYNESDKKIKMVRITNCPSCNTPVVSVGVEIVCPNEFGCKGIYSSKLEFLLGNLNVKNIGPSTISKIVDLMISDGLELSYYNFFKINLDDRIDDYLSRLFKSINSKRAENYKYDILSLFNNLTETKLMGSFNIPSVGKTTLVKNNITSINKLMDYYKQLKSTNIQNSAFDYTILKWCDDKRHIDDLIKCGKLLKDYFKEDEIDNDGKLTYCISGEIPGYTKNEIIEKLLTIKPNMRYVKDVKSNINFLISHEEDTVKVLKAKKYKIPIIKFEELLEK